MRSIPAAHCCESPSPRRSRDTSSGKATARKFRVSRFRNPVSQIARHGLHVSVAGNRREPLAAVKHLAAFIFQLAESTPAPCRQPACRSADPLRSCDPADSQSATSCKPPRSLSRTFRCNGLVHDHPARRSATLSGSAHGAEKYRLHRHLQIGARRDDQRVVAAEFQNRSTQPSVNRFGDIKSHVGRAGSRYQRNARIIRQFLSDRFTIADQQSKNRRISAGFATDALGDFRDGDCGERRFFRRLPNRGVTAHGSERGVPRPNCDRKIERGDHCDDAERMPLFHQPVTRSLRLNR